jgi:Major tropism determinant N-terminal domain
MAVQIQLRRDTAANWTSDDPTLAQGELGIEIDTDLAKLGDGSTAWTALPYWPAGGTSLHFEPAFAENAVLNNMSLASFPGSFANRWQTSPRRNTDWDEYLKHLFWAFYCPNTGNSLPATKYATLDAMAVALQAIVPFGGGVFNGSVLLWTYESVDFQDPYPMERHMRNSLLATIMGKGRWLRPFGGDRFGVSSNFNAPQYYLNFYNRLGIELVNRYNGQTPPTNNDGAIWFSSARRGGLWNYPKVGGYVQLPGVGTYRGAAWDTVAQAWVGGINSYYQIQPPFYLHEPGRQAILTTDYMASASDIFWPLRGVAVAVHPVTRGNNVAFLLHPAGFDCWTTDLVPAGYDHVVRVRFRHENCDRILVLTPHSSDGERDMYQHFASGDSIIFPLETPAMHVDGDNIANKVEIARRNQTTGVRSPWVPLGRVKRRLVNAPLRFDPDYRQ